MDNPIRLSQPEIVVNRPFTHPGRSLDDVVTLQHMRHQLRLALSQLDPYVGLVLPLTLNIEEPGGRSHRIIIANRAGLLANHTLTVVGFFGHKRPDADPTAVNAVDDVLIGEFSEHPGILSYSSLMLADGNCGNLVMLGLPEARDHWRASPTHQYAVRELTPRYYATLRLHNATLPGGLMGKGDVTLGQTKYYDFNDVPAWHAIREFVAD